MCIHIDVYIYIHTYVYIFHTKTYMPSCLCLHFDHRCPRAWRCFTISDGFIAMELNSQSLEQIHAWCWSRENRMFEDLVSTPTNMYQYLFFVDLNWNPKLIRVWERHFASLFVGSSCSLDLLNFGPHFHRWLAGSALRRLSAKMEAQVWLRDKRDLN